MVFSCVRMNVRHRYRSVYLSYLALNHVCLHLTRLIAGTRQDEAAWS